MTHTYLIEAVTGLVSYLFLFIAQVDKVTTRFRGKTDAACRLYTLN